MEAFMLILASSSPRRQKLLKRITKDFEILPADIDETAHTGESPRDYVQRMSVEKAAVVQHKRPIDIVIAADTIVATKTEILGKPINRQDAKRMLSQYSGASHYALTGVTIQFRTQIKTFVAGAKVHFYPISEQEIEHYLDTNEWQDKAGAYAIQGAASLFIKGIEGDYLTIVGFPIAKIYHELPPFFEAESQHQAYLDKKAAEQLDSIAYQVTRQAGTERPFSGQYDQFNDEGIYVDPLSGEVLFSSTDKFDAGCGWPAFAKPVNDLRERTDSSHQMVRTEVKSLSSDAHLGHVFDDGPAVLGGLRYCINSAALKFIPKDEMEDEGYSKYLSLFN